MQWNTYGTWLPGDGRGFRTKHHRVHIEGDYRLPPPPGTYDDWLEVSRALMKRRAVILPPQSRAFICSTFGGALLFHRAELVELAVGAVHFHLLARFTPVAMPDISQTPDTPYQSNTPGSGDAGLCEDDIDWSARDPRVRYVIGKAKSWSSREAKRTGAVSISTGGLWAARGKVVPIRSRGHQLAVVKYIRDHVREGAAVWSMLPRKTSTPGSGDPGL